ncbi:trypsin-like peptidase domain-containing protein [Streptomyces sp. NPDC058045]|uniref:trypsin-like peptidase domain-containing protein n=1 Tax=Streptomyces sp. NPDC058045 TaxID=3346311 RepID=UPI0036E49B02
MSATEGGYSAATGLDPRRAVQVLATAETGARRRGSGYRVTADTVLTAAHVVRDAPSIRLRFFADGGRTSELPGVRVWLDVEADIAVLRIEHGRGAGGPLAAEVPPVRFARVTGVVECDALGFPRFKLRREPASDGSGPPVAHRDSHHARGTTTPLSNVRQGTLELSLRAPQLGADRDRSPWEGMSGAAVWSGGCLIGVVSEHHHADGPGTLAASQVRRWYEVLAPERLRELHELIGLPVGAGQLEQVPPPRSEPWLAATAEELASWVQKQWSVEELRRNVHDPFPMRVRFRNATGPFDNWSNICLDPPGSRTPSAPLVLAGELGSIVDEYRKVPSHRLVVLGEAGAGKTILALRFVLDRLGARSPGDPVPVIFSLGSWDPAVSLHDWMCDRLVRDYPDLNVPAPDGSSPADSLLHGGRVLPILDGFDEIAGASQSAALRAINATTMPLLLTSRPKEYATAVRHPKGAVLRGAAGIMLDPLDLEALAEYLRRASPPLAGGDETRTAWEPVLKELSEESRGAGARNVAEALSTPLMVALARTVYHGARDQQDDQQGDQQDDQQDGQQGDQQGDQQDEDRPQPTELLDTARFPTATAVEDHLLSAFVPAAYDRPPVGPRTSGTGAPVPRRRRWDPERAEHWLGYLAWHLDRLGQGERVTRDLAWWELGTTMRRSARTLAVGGLASLAFGITTAVGNIPVDLVATSRGLEFALIRGVAVGLLHGSAAGLIFGLIYWFLSGHSGIKPLQVRMRLTRGAWKRHTEVLQGAVTGVVVGVVASAVLLVLDRVVIRDLGLDDGLGGGRLAAYVFLAELGLGGGLVFGLTALLEAPLQSESAARPTDLLNANRRRVAFRLALWALVIGPLVGLVEGVWHGPVRGIEAGAVFGLEAAFGAGLAYGCGLTAWGQWVALARIWLPLTGRLPWRLMAFLDDAHRREVLRQAGAVYQFRHASVQGHLSKGFREHSTKADTAALGNPPPPNQRQSDKDIHRDVH